MTFLIGDTGPTSDSTSDYPYSTVVYVTATFSSGQVLTGTGFIANQNNVITASHLVYNDLYGGRADSVTITAGLDGTNAPFGSFTTSSFYANVWDENSNFEVDSSDEAANDYAVLGFDQNIDSKGGATTTGYVSVSNGGSDGDYYLTGYSDNYENNGPRMTNDWGYLGFPGSDKVAFGSGVGTNESSGEFEADSSMAGSPFWVYSNGTPYANGMVSYVDSGGTGYGPAFTGDTFTTIDGVMTDHALLLIDNDDYTGTSGNDTKESGDGYDTLRGEAGDDYLQGNADSDLLYGGDDNDTLRGGQGNDTLYGDGGADSLYGDIGSDKIYGGSGDDFINGGRISSYEGDDSDTIYGGAGNDFIQANLADDVAYGDEGNDTVRGGGGNDSLWGDEGDDLMYGDKGNDKIWGGDGTDIARFQGNQADYFIDDIGSGNYSVTHIAGTYGEDTVYSDVETLQFDDGTLSI